MMRKLKLVVLFFLVTTSLGCFAQDISIEEMQMLDQMRAGYAEKGVQLKPEDEIRLLQRIRAMKSMAARMGSGMPPVAQAPQAAAAEPLNASITEAGLLKAISALPPATRLNSYTLMKDGLKFNNQRFADPEGVAEKFALDPDTSTAAYLVPAGASTNVKVVRLGSGADPVTIGRLSKNGGGVTFQTVTGKSISGDLFFPLTDGALLMRDSVGFRYVVGEGVKQIDFPPGWGPTPLQRGNTSTTGWILLERDTSAEKNSIFSSLKGLGSMVGLAPANMDYALFNLNDRKLVPFEISTDGKTVASYSQCRKSSNGLVNLCDRMTTYDSLWDKNGSPNWTHYFWAVDWQKVQGRPIAVVMEKSLRQVNAVDLTTSKKVNLFERTLGINSWSLEMAEEGKYKVRARLAFDNQVVDDLAQEVQNRPEIPKQQ